MLYPFVLCHAIFGHEWTCPSCAMSGAWLQSMPDCSLMLVSHQGSQSSAADESPTRLC